MSTGAAKALGSGPRPFAVPALERGDVEAAGSSVAEVSRGTAPCLWRGQIATWRAMMRMVVSVGDGRARSRREQLASRPVQLVEPPYWWAIRLVRGAARWARHDGWVVPGRVCGTKGALARSS